MTALLRHLPHFGPAPRESAPAPRKAPAMPAAPAFDPEEARRAASEARRAALEEAGTAHAAAFAAAEAEFEARLDARLAQARAAWCIEESERLATVLAHGLDGLESRIGDTLAAVLRPFLAETVRTRAVESLARRVRDLLRGNGPAPVLAVTGPGDLLCALRARLPELAGITFAEAAQADLGVTCDDSLLETQIGAWAELMSDTSVGGQDGGQG